MRLGQAGGRGGDDRAGRLVGEQLQRQRRAVAPPRASAPRSSSCDSQPRQNRTVRLNASPASASRCAAAPGSGSQSSQQNVRLSPAASTKSARHALVVRVKLDLRRQRQGTGRASGRRAPLGERRLVRRPARSRSGARTRAGSASRRGRRAPGAPGDGAGPGSRWMGMKSCTSPTPSGVRKRVIRTFVSGK